MQAEFLIRTGETVPSCDATSRAGVAAASSSSSSMGSYAVARNDGTRLRRVVHCRMGGGLRRSGGRRGHVITLRNFIAPAAAGRPDASVVRYNGVVLLHCAVPTLSTPAPASLSDARRNWAQFSLRRPRGRSRDQEIA